MISISVNSNIFRKDMNRFRKENTAALQFAILDATLTLKKLAKLKVRNFTRKSKVKSSFLINNILERITDKGLTGEVVSHAEYSQAFEEGTRPHIVLAKNKKVLAGPYRGRPDGWIVSKQSKAMGYAVYGKEVRHPGTPPHPFLFPAWKFAINKLEQNIKKAFR